MTRVTVKVASNWRGHVTRAGVDVTFDRSFIQRWQLLIRFGAKEGGKCEKCVAYPYGILLTTRMFGHKLNVLQGHINVWA